MSKTIFETNYVNGQEGLSAKIAQTSAGKYHLHALKKGERIARHKMEASEFEVFWDDLHTMYNHPTSDFNSVFALHSYAKCGTFDKNADPISENVLVRKSVTKKGLKRAKKAAKSLVKTIRNLSAEDIEDLDDYQQSSGLPISVGLTLFEGKIDELQLSAGHENGAIWFDVDTTKTDPEIVADIVDLVDLAHDLLVGAKNDRRRW